MELTKEQLEQILDQKLDKLVTEQVLDEKLDQKLSKFATKDDLKNFPTRDDLNNAILASEKKIIARIDEAQEELAIMAKNGFDDVLEPIDRVNVKPRVEKLEKQMTELKTALHLS